MYIFNYYEHIFQSFKSSSFFENINWNFVQLLLKVTNSNHQIHQTDMRLKLKFNELYQFTYCGYQKSSLFIFLINIFLLYHFIFITPTKNGTKRILKKTPEIRYVVWLFFIFSFVIFIVSPEQLLCTEHHLANVTPSRGWPFRINHPLKKFPFSLLVKVIWYNSFHYN